MCKSSAAKCFFLVLALASQGCWGPQVIPQKPKEAPWQHLGTVAVVSTSSNPEVTYKVPAKGLIEAMSYGFSDGFYVGNDLGQQISKPFLEPPGHNRCYRKDCQRAKLITLTMGLVIRVATPTIESIVGGVMGAFETESEEKVQASDVSLKDAFHKLRMQESLQEMIVRIGQENIYYPISLADSSSPAAGTDTLLLTEIKELGLVSNGASVNPPLRVFLTVDTSLNRRLDGKELDRRTYTYLSGPNSFSKWGDDNARLFREELDKAYVRLGEQIVQELFSEPENTLEIAERFLAKDPNDPRALVIRAEAKTRLRYDAAGARRDVERAIALNPQMSRAFLVRGDAESQAKNFAAAVISYDRALELRPDWPIVYARRARAKAKQLNFQGALEDYNRALQAKSDYAEALAGRGFVWMYLGDNTKAYRDFYLAIEFDPFLAEAYYGRSYITGDSDYRKALELKPSLPRNKPQNFIP